MAKVEDLCEKCLGLNVINTSFLHKFVNCVSAGSFSSARLAWLVGCDHVIIAPFSHVNTLLCVYVCDCNRKGIEKS